MPAAYRVRFASDNHMVETANATSHISSKSQRPQEFERPQAPQPPMRVGNSCARSLAAPSFASELRGLLSYKPAASTVRGPSKTVRLITSLFATCGPWALPLGAKKNVPVE